MTLTNALNASVAGLNVAQASLGLVAQNVSNSNNPNFTRKVSQQEAVIVGDVGLGVRISEIRRVVDQFLARQLNEAAGEKERFDVQQIFLDRLQATLGEPSSEQTLNGRLDQVFAAFEQAGTFPQSVATRSEIIESLRALQREANDIFVQIQTIRREIDVQIQQEVNIVNDALKRIEDLNRTIGLETNTGGNPTEFEDLRDTQLRAITDRMNVTTFSKPDGSISIFAGTGGALLEGSARFLDFSTATVVAPETVFDRIQVFSLDNNDNPTGVGIFVEGDIVSGRLRGLLDLRDRDLPSQSQALGEFISRLTDEVNRFHNDTTGFPPANSLVGQRNTGLTTADNHNFTGLASFAVMDTDNQVTNSVTVDFGAIGGTVNDVINAVNAGLGGAATMALTNGVLSLTATAGTDGVGVVQDTTTPSDRNGRGFAHFFGLNDLVTTGSRPNFFDYGFTAGETHQFTGDTTFAIQSTDGSEVANITFDSGAAGATFAALATDITTALAPFGSVTFDAAAGGFQLVPATGFTISANDEGNADRGGTGAGLATLMGLGSDKVELATEAFEIHADVDADPTRVGFGVLQTTVGGDGITPGDSRGALLMTTLASRQVVFNATANIPTQNVTLGNYAGLVINEMGNFAANSDSRAKETAALFSAIENKYLSLSAVNVDEELSNMIVLQNAFSAAARMISTVDQMFDELLSIRR